MGCGRAMSEKSAQLRVVFLLRLQPGRGEEFRAAYEAVRYRVAAVPGYLGDQLCQAVDDPEHWLITSEWASLEHFLAWQRTPSHRELAAPMMACVADRSSLRYTVCAATAAPTGGNHG
jgi:heme oxygenase (mycobilin-producing)